MHSILLHCISLEEETILYILDDLCSPKIEKNIYVHCPCVYGL